MTRRTVLGNRNLLISLHAPVGKDKQVAGYIKKEGGKKQNKIITQNAATVVNKAESYIQPAPEEHREPENLTGIPREELFGPDFLYEEPKIWTE